MAWPQFQSRHERFAGCTRKCGNEVAKVKDEMAFISDLLEVERKKNGKSEDVEAIEEQLVLGRFLTDTAGIVRGPAALR